MLNKIFVRNISAGSVASQKISSTLILARNPIITRDVPAFESQYYKYQNELWKRLMWTFPKWFYYRPGTLGEQNFKELNKNPVYNNPNLEFPQGRPDIKQQRDRRFKQELRLPKTYKVDADGNEIVDPDAAEDNLSRKIVPNSRVTEADEKKDLTSLERNLGRTLYLVISNDSKTWSFPKFELPAEGEVTPLHEAAEQGLYSIGGDQINYYNVSPKPCHVIAKDQDHDFFIKSHIMSGSFKPTGSTKFLWLAKDELPEYLNNDYYNEIKHLLNDI